MSDWLDEVLTEMPVERDSHWRQNAMGGKAEMTAALRRWYSRRQLVFNVSPEIEEQFRRTARRRDLSMQALFEEMVRAHCDS